MNGIDHVQLRQLECFIAVAQELHFGRAALLLNMTQPPLSQQIQRLETEIGVQLLRRSKRHVELTAAGQVFLDEIRPIFKNLQKAIDATKRAEMGLTGRLNVGFVGSAIFDLLPRIIREYGQRVPQVDIVLHELATGFQVEALHRGDLDVGVLRPPISSSHLNVTTVQTGHCVAVLPADHDLAWRDEVGLEDMLTDPFVILTRGTWTGFYDELMGLCHGLGFSPNIRLEATEFPTVIGLVAAGLGVAVVPASAENLQAREVVYKPLKPPAPSADMALAWRCIDTSPVLQEFLRVAQWVAGANVQ